MKPIESTSTKMQVSALYEQALALHQKNKLQHAKVIYEQILKIQPNHFDSYALLGLISGQNNQFKQAVDFLTKALQINPNHAETFYNKGLALKQLKHFEESLASYDKAIALKPDYAEAYSNRGNVLQELKRFDEAITSYNHTISLKPDYVDAFINRGNVLKELKRFEEAFVSYDKAIQINPNYPDAYYNRGVILQELRRFEEAVDCYDVVLKIRPDFEFITGTLQYVKMLMCNWKNLDNQKNFLLKRINANEKVARPFSILALMDTPTTHRACAELFIKANYPQNNTLGCIPKTTKQNKIRLGYFSEDFRNHPVSFLTAELFELHHKDRFEIIAFSFGPDVKDEMYNRLSKAFDQFIDVRNKTDQEVALLSRDLGIDIAIDLGGYTSKGRTGIFSFRTAPIQINYLGYPGTMGANYIDYIIADHTLIPAKSRGFYSEKIIYLPNSYQANDSTRLISDKELTKAELGLPEVGFVFGCFNNNYKITPSTFNIWCKILAKVEGSVLWLLDDNPTAKKNLKREAQMRGISESRLIFAERLELSEHLARHRKADLFLDTFPYNAHTTASDALWAGLPVLTMMGESFASRVAASLLTAIDLPELITRTQEQYEALAIELATNSAKLKAIKAKLDSNRLSKPLFDTPRFTKHLEDAYKKMYERYHADLPPEHIYIEDEAKTN